MLCLHTVLCSEIAKFLNPPNVSSNSYTDKIMTTLSKVKQLLPLLLLTVFSSQTIYCWICGDYEVNGEFYPFSPTADNYIALLTIFACLLVFLFSKRHYKFFLILTLILGFFNLISFTTFRETFSMKVNGGNEGIKIQPVAIYAIVLTYILNFRRFNNYVIRKSDERK